MIFVFLVFRGVYLIILDEFDIVCLLVCIVFLLVVGVIWLQYCNKIVSDVLWWEQVIVLQVLCVDYGVLLIVNDDLVLVKVVGVVGVYLGGIDGDIFSVCVLFGFEVIIGVFCYDQLVNVERVVVVGVSYVVFGVFFLIIIKIIISCVYVDLLW